MQRANCRVMTAAMAVLSASRGDKPPEIRSTAEGFNRGVAQYTWLFDGGSSSALGRLAVGMLIFLSSLVFAESQSRRGGETVAADFAPLETGDRRVALVIGNANYKSSPLANPIYDARGISSKLKILGFEVITYENLTHHQAGAALREFRSKLRPGGVALFFYAGHGVQVNGVNYLPLVDAEITSEDDVQLQSLSVSHVLDLMDQAKTRLNLVFLDACRNNPFLHSFRAAARGLAKIDAPSGTIISFATRPGSVASDGTGKNGLYGQYRCTRSTDRAHAKTRGQRGERRVQRQTGAMDGRQHRGVFLFPSHEDGTSGFGAKAAGLRRSQCPGKEDNVCDGDSPWHVASAAARR